jgi:hypothetical protein
MNTYTNKKFLARTIKMGLLTLTVVAAFGIGGGIVKALDGGICTQGVACTGGQAGCVRNWNSNQACNNTPDPHGYLAGLGQCGAIWDGIIPTLQPCGWYNAEESCG